MKSTFNTTAILDDCTEKVKACNPQIVFKEGSFLYIDISSIDNTAKQITSVNNISGIEAPSRARQLVEKGDVLVSTVRPNLNAVAYVSEEYDGAVASTGFCVLRPSPKILLPKYLYYWVRSSSFVSEMVKKATGASYPAVSDNIIKSSEIPLPPLSIQREIAEILGKADALRQKDQLLLQKYDELAQSIFYDMFGDPVKNEKGWEVKSLMELTHRITDGKHGDCENEPGSGYYFISAKDLIDGEIKYDGVREITKIDFEDTHRRTNLQLHDILIGNTGASIGKIAVANNVEKYIRTTFQKSIAIVTPDDKKITPEFLRFFLTLNADNLENISSGSGQKNLLLSQLREFKLIKPDLSLQNGFEKKMKSLSLQRRLVTKQYNHAQKLFNSLLYSYFTN